LARPAIRPVRWSSDNNSDYFLLRPYTDRTKASVRKGFAFPPRRDRGFYQRNNSVTAPQARESQ
jgi:hypothetical protein